MSKLDEIETLLTDTVSQWPRRDQKRFGEIEARLLIRTARQLGAIVRERESAAITRNRLEPGIYSNLIDPDVMELLPE